MYAYECMYVCVCVCACEIVYMSVRVRACGHVCVWVGGMVVEWGSFAWIRDVLGKRVFLT